MVASTIRPASRETPARKLTKVFVTLAATLSWCSFLVGAARVLDLNENLPDLVEKHDDKNWLVKFYAPWCYHCQQLEPTYNNVAESIYHRHDNLVVGRVDCTKSARVCEQFGVSSYPTITFINQHSQIPYRGDRSEESLLAFADRLQGPTVNLVSNCKELNQALDKHGLIILSTISNDSNPIKHEFEALAQVYKSTHWFYHYPNGCKDLIYPDSLFLLKRHLNRSVQFIPRAPSGETETDNENLKNDIVRWLNRESFSIFPQISFRNIERVLATGKLIVISILDEYKPAGRFCPTSREFYRKFELLAREYAQKSDDLMLSWSSDIELIEYITITPISRTPNVILLKPDYSYHLMLSNSSDESSSEKNYDKVDVALLEALSNRSIRSLIEKARGGNLDFHGGDTYLFAVMRYIMGNIHKFTNMYRANPLLVSVIFGFPSLIIVFVIYTTCFYEGRESEDEDEGYSDNEYDDEGDEDEKNRPVPGNDHLKQE